MATDTIRVDITPTDKAIDLAAARLRQGGVVIFPTDTLYGVGAIATLDDAVRRVFLIKGRDLSKPLPLLLADPQDIVLVAADVPDTAWVLTEHFWPGGLTVVVKRNPQFHSLALAGGDTVAVRVPDQSIARAIIRAAGAPVTGTSANRAGGPAPRTATEAAEQIGNAVDLLIDAGVCPGGVESTVLDVTEQPPRILRAGAIRREEIESVLGFTIT